jgi:S1-C subfamily serine protease
LHDLLRRAHRVGTLLILALCAAWATAATEPAPPSVQTQIERLNRAHGAVVGLRVAVGDDAPSAETLGRTRTGSGVVIDKSGLILTIGYLMLEAQDIQIVTQDNKTLPAQAVAYDQATGFGLVRTVVPLQGIEPAILGSLADASTGEPVMAVSGIQADGSDSDVNMVQLVGKRPFSGYWEYHIDAAAFTSPPIANHSGAPLFNRQGEVIGIGSLLVSDAMGAERRLPGNMFVPIDLLKPILDEMRNTGTTARSHRPWIGITSTEQAGRVQILRVSKNSPAQQAGLQPGDLVLAVDGTTVSSLEALYKKLWDRAAPDAAIPLTVLQGADIRAIRLRAVDRQRSFRKPAGI